VDANDAATETASSKAKSWPGAGARPRAPVDETDRIAGPVVAQADEFVGRADGLRCGFPSDLETRRAGDVDGRQAVAVRQHGECGRWRGDAAAALEEPERVGKQHAEVVERNDSAALRREGDPRCGHGAAFDGQRSGGFPAFEDSPPGEKPAPAVV